MALVLGLVEVGALYCHCILKLFRLAFVFRISLFVLRVRCLVLLWSIVVAVSCGIVGCLVC